MRHLKKQQNEQGFVVVLMAISMMALIAIMGFAIDVGSWYLNASRLQRAADGAALSGTAALPDTDAANAAVLKSLTYNGFVNNQNGISVHTTVNASSKQVSVNVENNDVPTYFTHAFITSLSMNRSSTARQASSQLELGSPYNVLGAGPISKSSPIPKQNYWLSINARCAPVEDGDYFSSYGGYKTGLDDSKQSSVTGFFPSSDSAKHVCKTNQPSTNPNYTPSGYKYFVDVPPSSSSGSVTLAVFDGEDNPGDGSDYKGSIDKAYLESKNELLGGTYYDYHVFNPQGVDVKDYTLVTEDHRAEWQWVALYTLSDTENHAGGVWSITVSENLPDQGYFENFGANSYSIGAFRNAPQSVLDSCDNSGNNCPMGCDSRKTADCPRVYAQNAMSVLTNSSSKTTDADFSFAEVDPSNIGRTFYVYLWDPGEGTKDIQLLDGGGKPMNFSWSASGAYMPYPLTGPTTILQTGGSGPCPLVQADHCSGLSNNYKFNDRLVTLQVTVDQQYVDDAKQYDNDWVSLHYDFSGGAQADRTTWGISLTGGSSSPPRLVRSDAN